MTPVLELTLIAEPGAEARGLWRVSRPYAREWRGRRVVVPAGFVTDGPSIPERLRSIVPVRGLMWGAALIHDWLYWATREAGLTGWTRREADRVFLDLLAEDGVGWLTRRLMWLAVRIGGWVLWRSPRRG